MTIKERLQTFLSKKPQIDPTANIHPSAVLIGDVRIGPNVTILPLVVIRGDINYIEIGACSNIQDGSVIHLSDDHPVIIKNWVTVGHAAVIHGCTIEEGALIGMHTTILDGATIGKEAIVGAHSLISKGTQVPARTVTVGIPGRVVRDANDDEIVQIREIALKYVEVGNALRTA